jgi:anti-sigma B factor antagonist
MYAEISALPSGYVLVALSGDLDAVTALAARQALAEATSRAVTGVIADLAAVTFLDAAGLGVLAGAAGRARNLPDGLRLAAVPPNALRLLKLTRLDRHLAAYPMPPHREHPRTDTAPDLRQVCR